MIKNITIADIQLLPGKSKNGGKDYMMMIVKTVAGGDAKMSSFINRENDPRLQWKVGEEHEVVIKQNGQYFNFSIPQDVDYLREDVEVLKKEVSALKQFITKPI